MQLQWEVIAVLIFSSCWVHLKIGVNKNSRGQRATSIACRIAATPLCPTFELLYLFTALSCCVKLAILVEEETVVITSAEELK